MGVTRRIVAVLAAAGTACGGGSDVVRESDTGTGQAEIVTFSTADEVELAGLKFGSGDTAVVLGHMAGSTKEAWTDVAVSLSNNGFTAFAFDFRGYAGQEGERDTNADADMLAAIEAMRTAGAEQVFAIGASMGGTAAVAAAAEADLAGVAALSAPAAFGGVDASAAAPDVEEPALFLVARDDQPYAQETAALAEAAGGRLVTYDGGAHGTDLVAEHGDTVIAQLLRFVQDPAAEAAPTP